MDSAERRRPGRGGSAAQTAHPPRGGSPPLAELQTILRKKLLTLRRAEWHRRRRKERARKRASLVANPFGFTKQLLGQKRSGRLDCLKGEIDLHIQTTYSHPDRQQRLGHCNTLMPPPPPTREFDSREPLLKEVQDVVREARSSSAPGPSGVQAGRTLLFSSVFFFFFSLSLSLFFT